MPRRASVAVAVLAVALAAAGCGLHGGRVAILEENDVANLGDGLDVDRDYTQGGLAALTLSAEDTPGWAREAAEALPLFRKGGEVRLGILIGQEMYTPEDLAIHAPIPDDRPYGGWLHVGLALEGRALDADADRRRDRRDLLEVDLGVVGPASLAEPSQDVAHRILEIPGAEGWDNQLKNEPALQAAWERRWRLLRGGLGGDWSAEALPIARARAGTVRVDAAAGALGRIGWNVPRDFGPTPVDGTGLAKGAPRARPSAYLFAGGEARGVVHDLFVEGGTFRGGPSATATNFVHDATAGIAAGWGNLSAEFAMTWRSPEFRERRRYHQFSTVLVAWTWWF